MPGTSRKQGDQGHSSRESATSKLLSDRATVWNCIRKWAVAMPKRNSVCIGGDLNACLLPQRPHVGSGTQGHKKSTHTHTPGSDGAAELGGFGWARSS